MIWLRRAVAVLLVFVFIALFLAAAVVSHLSGSLFGPGFYVEQLRKADAYSFVYDQALPLAFRQFTKGYERTGVDLKTAEAEAVIAARQVFPPDWLQTQVEELLLQALPYVLGDTDAFSLKLPLADRVELAGKEAKRLLKGSPTVDFLYQKLTATLADRLLENMGELPPGLRPITRDSLVAAIRTVATKEWVVAQVEAAIDQLVPYVQGRVEHFAITVRWQERAKAASQALKELSRQSDAASLVLDGVVRLLVDETVSQITRLPYGVRLTQEEARSAVRQVASPAWVQARLDDLVDVMVAYLTGTANTVQLTVPLGETRLAAYRVLTELADRKLESALSSLPQCSLQQFRSLPLRQGELPACRPEGISYAEAKRLLGVDLSALVQQAFANQIPDSWTLREGQVRQVLGAQVWDAVQSARGWVTRGYTYTDADLRDDLGEGQERVLDLVRQHNREGGDFTQATLRDELGKNSGGRDALEILDSTRSGIHTVRRWVWPLWLVSAMPLLAIGFLGGRTWGSRLAWAGAALVCASLVLLVVAGPVYSSVVDPQAWVTEAFKDASEAAEPLVNKAAQMAQSAASAVGAGIRLRAWVALAVGVVALAGGIAWHRAATRPIVPEVIPPARNDNGPRSPG